MGEQGEKLFQQYGCVTCHVTDREGRCPSLLNVFGRPVVLDDGRTVMADEAYIRESILNPNAKIVKGYKHDIMPVFQGQISEEGLLQLIVYIKSLSPPAACRPLSQPHPLPNGVQNEYDTPVRANRDAHQLSERGLRVEVVAVHHGPQTHRAALSVFHYSLLLCRRRFRRGDADQSADAGRHLLLTILTTSCSRCTGSSWCSSSWSLPSPRRWGTFWCP